MRRRAFLVASSALLAISAVACATETEDDAVSAEAAHTEGRHVHDNSPFYWAAEPYEDFRSTMELLGHPLEPVLPDDDALTVRVQTWLDRIDAIVRADVERETGRPLVAPKPIAKIVRSATTFNAWVSPTLACLGAPLGSPVADASRALVSRTNVDAYPLPTCARPDWDRAAFASFWNASRPACALSFNGDTFGVGTSCNVAQSTLPSADVMVTATAPYVHFSTDFIAAGDEADLVMTAAHELGHYYLAHCSEVAAAKYGYWFRRGDGDMQPRPDPNAEALAAAYAEVVTTNPIAGPPLGKQYSPRMRELLVRVVWPLLMERPEADFACAAARDALAPVAGELQVGSGPYSEEARKGYETFESELFTCARRVALGGAEPQSISAGTLLLQGALHRPGPKTKLALRIGDTLADFLDRLDAQAKDLDAKAARLVASARANHIGLYTTEQAADDFSMEIGTRLGFTTDEVLASWINTMRGVEALIQQAYTPEQADEYYRQTGDLRSDACKALLDAGFTRTDEQGRRTPVTVDMGQLEEPHHANCYRLYNLFRESRVHRYTIGTRPPALEPAWPVLKARAAELARTASPPPAPSSMPGGPPPTP